MARLFASQSLPNLPVGRQSRIVGIIAGRRLQSGTRPTGHVAGRRRAFLQTVRVRLCGPQHQTKKTTALTGTDRLPIHQHLLKDTLDRSEAKKNDETEKKEEEKKRKEKRRQVVEAARKNQRGFSFFPFFR